MPLASSVGRDHIGQWLVGRSIQVTFRSSGMPAAGSSVLVPGAARPLATWPRSAPPSAACSAWITSIQPLMSIAANTGSGPNEGGPDTMIQIETCGRQPVPCQCEIRSTSDPRPSPESRARKFHSYYDPRRPALRGHPPHVVGAAGLPARPRPTLPVPCSEFQRVVPLVAALTDGPSLRLRPLHALSVLRTKFQTRGPLVRI
jgi:hypothetical protein